MDNKNFQYLIDILNTASTVGCFCHVNPDADCIGSMLAFYMGIRKLCPDVQISMFTHDNVPSYLAFLPKVDFIRNREFFHSVVGSWQSAIGTKAQRHLSASQTRQAGKGTEKLSIVDCRLSIENSNNQPVCVQRTGRQLTTNNQDNSAVGNHQITKLSNYQIATSHQPSAISQLPDYFDAAVLVDCGEIGRCGDTFLPLVKTSRNIINIDHHKTNTRFGTCNIVEDDASSTCEIIYKFLTASKISIDYDIAMCIYTGIMFDTGRFRHSNTSKSVFKICAALLDYEINPSEIANRVYDNRTASHLKLLGYTLSNICTSLDEKIAWVLLPKSVFKSLGATDEDTEGLVDVLGMNGKVQVFGIFKELSNRKVKASLRSKGLVDVSEICRFFGGGGHSFAGGFKVNGDLENIVNKVIIAVENRLKD